MPAKTESNRTQPVESGGTQPVWQKQKHESDLVLTWPEGDDSSLLLELWNKNATADDDFIGSTMIKLMDNVTEKPTQMRSKLDTGGQLEFDMYYDFEDQFQRGTLEITFYAAKDLRDLGVVTDQDPYVQVELVPSGAKQTTLPHTGGGVSPVWTPEHQHTLSFDLVQLGWNKLDDDYLYLLLFECFCFVACSEAGQRITITAAGYERKRGRGRVH
jgi:Ca2+-dependent lipid-binding protein